MDRILLPLLGPGDQVVTGFALEAARAFHLELATVLLLEAGNAEVARPGRSVAGAAVASSTVTVVAPFGPAIEALAQQQDAVMLSASGRAGGRWVGHNVFEHLTRHSPVPVWVVPDSARCPVRLTVAYDGHPRALEAAKLAAALSRQWQLPLGVLVISEGREVDERDVRYALEELYVRSVHESGVFYEQGPPAALLPRHAEPDGLLVMGSHGHSAPLGLAIGNTVDQVLGTARGSVLLCP